MVGNRDPDEVVPVMGSDVEERLELIVRGVAVPDGYAQAGAGVTVLIVLRDKRAQNDSK